MPLFGDKAGREQTGEGSLAGVLDHRPADLEMRLRRVVERLDERRRIERLERQNEVLSDAPPALSRGGPSAPLSLDRNALSYKMRKHGLLPRACGSGTGTMLGRLAFAVTLSAALVEAAEIGPGGGGAMLCAAIHPQNPRILLIGQDVGGVLKSADGGRSWRHVNKGIALAKATTNSMGIQRLMFSPNNPSIVFACTWGGVFRSVDTAESWTRVLPPEDEYEGYPADFGCIAVDPRDGRLVLVGTGDPFQGAPRGRGVFRSTDGGLTFSRLGGSGLPERALVSALIIDSASPASSRHVYAGTSEGLYRSIDHGRTYSIVNSTFPHLNVRAVVEGGSGIKRRLWVALQTETSGGGVYYSSDGLKWTDATGDLPLAAGKKLLRLHEMLGDPQEVSVVTAAMRDTSGSVGRLFRSTDSGRHWANLLPENADLGWNHDWPAAPYGAAAASSQPSQILLTNEVEPLLTRDGGLTWKQLGTRPRAGGAWSGTGAELTYVYALAGASTHPGRIYAGYEDIGLWRSDDRGNSWRQLFWYPTPYSDSDAASGIHVNPSDGGELYVVASSWSGGLREERGSSLLYSTDAGATWQNLTSAFDRTGARGAACVDFSNPASSRTVLYAQHAGTIRRSSDGGNTWTPAAKGFEARDAARIFVIAQEPSGLRRYYAGTHSDFGEIAGGGGGGLYRSDDDGRTWRRLTAFPYPDVNMITWAGSPQRLFVSGTMLDKGDYLARGGLLVSDDGGGSFTTVLDQPFVLSLTGLPGKPRSLVTGAAGHYVVAQNQNAGLYGSDDNGESWSRLGIELPHTGVLCILAPPWDPSRLYVGTRGAGIARVPINKPTIATGSQ